MENLAKTLTDFRKLSGKSQRDFAEMLDIPQTTWSGYESGKFNPPMKVLFALREKGFPIPGLTSALMDEETREALVIARNAARKLPPHISPDDEIYKKALKEAYERQNFPEGKFIEEFEKTVLRIIEPRIVDHESRLSALEEHLRTLSSVSQPKAEYTAKAEEGGGYTAEPEPEYGESSGPVAFREQVAAGPPIDQSEDEGLVVDVPLRYIRTKPGDYYALRIQGNSMIDALIPDGSMVLIRKSDAPVDGAIQVVSIDGHATLKRLREREDRGWRVCYEDGSGRTIPMGEGLRVQGDFVAVLPPSSRPRMRGGE
jgi:SOS-response transcriptional repressor LexA/DNA-binding XRE family transcriptional regulator